MVPGQLQPQPRGRCGCAMWPGSSTGSTSCDSAHVPRAEGPGSCWAIQPAPTSQTPSPNTLASGTDAGDGSRTGRPDCICPRYKLRSPLGDKLQMRGGGGAEPTQPLRAHRLTHAQRTRSPEPKFTRRSTLTNGARKAKADAAPGDADLGDTQRLPEARGEDGPPPTAAPMHVSTVLARAWRVQGWAGHVRGWGPDVRVRPPPRVRGPSGKTAPKAKRPGDQERGLWTLLWGFGGSQAAGVGLFWGPGRDSGPAKLWGSVVGALRVARPDSHVCILFRQVSAWRSTEIIRVPSAQQRARHPCAVGKWEAERRNGHVPRQPC